jgi:hypothetical protein
MHFQVWHDKAGNATALTDGNLTFPNLNDGLDPNTGANTVGTGSAAVPAADLFQTNLIMPEPTVFLRSNFGPVSIIRPTDPNLAAQGAVKSFVDDGLFIDPSTGQNTAIVAVLMQLAEEADEARRGFWLNSYYSASVVVQRNGGAQAFTCALSLVGWCSTDSRQDPVIGSGAGAECSRCARFHSGESHLAQPLEPLAPLYHPMR